MSITINGWISNHYEKDVYAGLMVRDCICFLGMMVRLKKFLHFDSN